MSVIGMFVALTQVDFMFIRIAADLMVNCNTTYYFLRGKIVNPALYNQWKDNQKEAQKSSWVAVDDNESELLETMRLHVLYILISTPGHESNIAAQKIDTLIVLPKRRGVEMRISCAIWSQLLSLSTLW